MVDRPLLDVQAVTKRFGGVVAVDGVSLAIPPAAVVGLIGPNGSGKTTLLNTINGVHRPESGEILLAGVSVVGRRPHELVAVGISRTFQTAHVFKTVSAYQNMLVPMLHRDPGARRAATRRAADLLAFVGLEGHGRQAASELSGGQQKLLEFARALITEPKLVLMDEPFAGVHPQIKSLLIDRIRETVRERGTSFLIVSHEIPDLMNISHSMVCLAQGRTMADGKPADVGRDERVIEAYLGHGGAVR